MFPAASGLPLRHFDNRRPCVKSLRSLLRNSLAAMDKRAERAGLIERSLHCVEGGAVDQRADERAAARGSPTMVEP